MNKKPHLHLIRRFRDLSGLGKFVVIIVGLCIIVLFVGLIITAFIRLSDQNVGDNNQTNPVTVDPLSGLNVDNTNTGAIPDPGPALVGVSVFLNYGLRIEMLQDIQTVLSTYYTDNQVDGQTVTQISFAQSLQHTITDDGDSSTYAIEIAFNTTIRKTLTVVAQGDDISTITVSDTDGQNPVSIVE